MAKTTQSDTIVVMDDELFNIQWLLDYLEALKYSVMPCASAQEAIQILSGEIYRALILDLNVPTTPEIQSASEKLGTAYQKYPGLYVAYCARNAGYRDRQVIVYSVHRDAEVAAETRRLGCTYILKGRPAELKEELKHVLSFDPTAK